MRGSDEITRENLNSESPQKRTARKGKSVFDVEYRRALFLQELEHGWCRKQPENTDGGEKGEIEEV